MKTFSHRPVLLCLIAICAVLAGLISTTVSSAVKGQGPIDPQATSIRVISLPTNDLVFSPADQKLYASIPGSDPNFGNTITAIDPFTGVIGTSTFIGSEPTKLALGADGQTLYTYLSGAHEVARLNVSTGGLGNRFQVGIDQNLQIFNANGISVSPDNPNIVAIARHNQSSSPVGVAVYESGIRLSQTQPGFSQGSSNVVFGGNGQTLFGTGDHGQLSTMAVSATGVTVTRTGAGSGALKYDSGKLFTSNGQVIDASSGTLLGTFPAVSTRAFAPEISSGKAYYVDRSPQQGTVRLRVFDSGTFSETVSVVIAGVSGEPKSLVRWGQSGLAFRTTANELVLLQTDLIPSPAPLPELPPLPSPSPSPTPYSSILRSIPLAVNDIGFSASSGKLYVSVPGSAGVPAGNTITAIDPATGAIVGSILIGSEPTRIAMAEDGNGLYVGIDGAGSVRHVNLVEGSAGQQFSLGNDTFGPNRARDLAIMPGLPQTVAVSRSEDRDTALYDSGIMRPQTIYGQGAIEFVDASTLVRNSGSLIRMNAGANGLSQVNAFSADLNGDIEYVNGRIYSGNGRVASSVGSTIVGTFSNVGYLSTFAVDEEAGRVFYLVNEGGTYRLKAFALDTFRLIGSVDVPGVGEMPGRLVRWGTNGLAFPNGNNLVLLQSDLVNPNSPLPAPTPIPSPTPSSLPATFVRTVDLSVNDLVFNPATNSIIASVPGSAGSELGNTMTYIDPISGQLTRSIFIGSEPTLIAASDDGATLYTSLNGTNAIRAFDAVTALPSTQFHFSTDLAPLRSLAVAPGNPNRVAVGGYQGHPAVFENGSALPIVPSQINRNADAVAFSSDQNVLFGYNNTNTGYNLVKFSNGAAGFSASAIGGGLVAGFDTTIKYHNGLIYGTNGSVVDPSIAQLVGTFKGGGTTMAIDAASNRAFFICDQMLTAYDLTSYVKIGSVPLPHYGGRAFGLTRWGINGLAYRATSTYHGSDAKLYIVSSALVSDAAPVPTGLRFYSSEANAWENDRAVNIVVIRTGDTSRAASVNFVTADISAAAGSDYIATSGTLVFDPGELSQTISVRLVQDHTSERLETFSITMSEPQGQDVVLDGPAVMNIEIIDDDSIPGISAVDLSASEPPSGGQSTARVRVALSNPSVETTTVNYQTTNISATAGLDYTPVGGTLTFAPMETEKSIDVPILADAFFEPDESFRVNFSAPVNSYLAVPGVTVTIKNHKAKPQFDFDGDGKSDVSVYRPSEGKWHIRGSQAGDLTATWGASTDRLVPGDYDGDGKTDPAIFRDGVFWILKSTGGFEAANWGVASDKPAPADYDGDGKTDPAVFRDGVFWILKSTGGVESVNWGVATDVPVSADYDGDGKADPAIFRDGAWWVYKSTGGYQSYFWGVGSDALVHADYDGDGKTDPAIFRDGVFWVYKSGGGSEGINWGLGTDTPVPADYDGDGRTDPAIYRNGDWWVLKSTGGSSATTLGLPNDLPVPAR